MRSTSSYIRIIVFGILGFFFLNWIGSTPEANAFEQYTWLWAVYGFIILFYVAGEICAGALQAVLYQSLKPDAQARYDEKIALEKENQFKWIKEKYKQSLGGKPMEEEHEIILDHNYDGIQELDNNLPPWWIYGFYASIIFAVVYLVRFHVFNDYDQATEYEQAVAVANKEIEEWKKTAKDLVDVNTVVLLTDASDLNAGKVVFTENCVACHKADGGGGIGPNLTDEYWILGGGIKNVFHTISEGGREGKGMVPWKQDLKPSVIAQVASYVLSLQGTTPAEPKEAEGELWTDPDAPKETKDAPKTAVDSTTVVFTKNK